MNSSCLSASRVLVGGMPKREADKSLKNLKRAAGELMAQAFYEQHDDVGELVLDAPPLNLFSPAMFDDLEAAIAHVAGGRRRGR